MAREMTKTKTMNATVARQDYLGAFLSEERRLVLVGIDENDPWEAFRSMRRAMRRGRAQGPDFDLYTANIALEHQADVIPLASRRRAG